MIIEHRLAKYLTRSEGVKLPSAGYLEEKKVKTAMSCSSGAGLASAVSRKDRQTDGCAKRNRQRVLEAEPTCIWFLCSGTGLMGL